MFAFHFYFSVIRNLWASLSMKESCQNIHLKDLYKMRQTALPDFQRIKKSPRGKDTQNRELRRQEFPVMFLTPNAPEPKELSENLPEKCCLRL